MENPEEVLQALDEFQKLRPADIPKELEEYLSWVAKTGDPVYQWPLIKALFREKLLRVMTDFYESCPTLELAPCPNVEQFNYDVMKSALLDRLESFANAPFTVQRICELLTAPRKEYNRVDKFMRAIEKNILVVSTREPGPTARRSENGDGMVNGSTEDNGSRSPYDMDLWTRTCTLATTVTVQTGESHSTIVNIHHLPPNIIPSTELTIVKSNPVSVEAFTPYGTDTDICDPEMASKNQDLPSTFTPSTSEIASIANLTSQIQPQDLNSTSGIQNLSNMVQEPSNIVGDVPEAIMNEDTNSQPSLDMESSENESFETGRKLQTTFQSSDFITHSIKSQKFYPDETKSIEKTVNEAESLRTDLEPLIELEQKPTEDNTEVVKPSIELKSPLKNEEPVISATEITADSIGMTDNIDKTTNAEVNIQNTAQIGEKIETTINTNNDNEMQVKECIIPDIENVALLKNETESASLGINTGKKDLCTKVILSDKEAESTLLLVTSETVISCKSETNPSITQNITTLEETAVVADSNNLKISNEEPLQILEKIQPADEGDKEIAEVSKSKECSEKNEKISDYIQQPSDTVEESSNENDTIIKSVVSNCLLITEPSKNEESVSDLDKIEPTTDITNEKQNELVKTALSVVESEKELSDTNQNQDISKINSDTTNLQSIDTVSIENSSVVTGPTSIQDIAPVESMEVDIAERSQSFQQDEPMEEEIGDLDKS